MNRINNPEKQIGILQTKIDFLKWYLANWKPKEQLRQEILELEKRIHQLKYSYLKGN